MPTPKADVSREVHRVNSDRPEADGLLYFFLTEAQSHGGTETPIVLRNRIKNSDRD